MLVQSSTYVLLNAARIEGDTLKISDYFFAGLILTEVVVSAIADQQQWSEFSTPGKPEIGELTTAIQITKRPNTTTKTQVRLQVGGPKLSSTEASVPVAFGHILDTPISRQSRVSGSRYISGTVGRRTRSTTGQALAHWRTY